MLQIKLVIIVYPTLDSQRKNVRQRLAGWLPVCITVSITNTGVNKFDFQQALQTNVSSFSTPCIVDSEK